MPASKIAGIKLFVNTVAYNPTTANATSIFTRDSIVCSSPADHLRWRRARGAENGIARARTNNSSNGRNRGGIAGGGART